MSVLLTARRGKSLSEPAQGSESDHGPAGMAPARRRRNPLEIARKTWLAWKRLSPFFHGSRALLCVLAAVALVAGLLESALIALIAGVASALAIGKTSFTTELGPIALDVSLSTLFAVGIVMALLRGALGVLLAFIPARVGAQAMADLRRRLFNSFLGASWSIKASERDGSFQSLMNAHVTTASQAIITLGHGISVFITFLTLVVSAFLLNLPAAVVLAVTSIILFTILRPLARRLRDQARNLSAENIEYSKGVQEVVLLAEETQVFGVSDTYRNAFYKLIDDVRLPLQRTRFLAEAVPGLFQSTALLLLVLALIAVSFVEVGQLAELGAVVLILIRALSYGQQVQSVLTSMDEKIPFMERLADAINKYDDNPQQDGRLDLPPVQSLSMQSVGYSYPTGAKVLSDIDFTVRRGEAIGIAGPSGAGKSSIVQILLRLREPTNGQLTVNDVDARSYCRSEWQRRIAYVPQTPQLIWGTVSDNIRFYRPELSEDDVRSAARHANIDDEIESWPEGYDTLVGQRASAVSGGQRQRICLARALAGHPEVLILDEATSALDVRSESLVHISLEGLKGQITLFMVSHRLSALSWCDRVLVLGNGRLQAFDEPARLAATNEFFREVDQISRRSSVADHGND